MWNLKSKTVGSFSPEADAIAGESHGPGAEAVLRLCAEYDAQVAKLERVVVEQERRIHALTHWILTHSSRPEADAFLAKTALSSKGSEEEPS